MIATSSTKEDGGKETARLYTIVTAEIAHADAKVGWFHISENGLDILLDKSTDPPVPFPGAPTTQALLKKLDSLQDPIERLIEISRRPTCEFGLHDSDETGELPDESLYRKAENLRKSTAVLVCDAVRQWENGDEDAAVERLLASYRIVHHLMKHDVKKSDDIFLFLSGQSLVGYSEVAVVSLVGPKCERPLSIENSKRVKAEIERTMKELRTHVQRTYRAHWNERNNGSFRNEKSRESWLERNPDEDAKFHVWLQSMQQPIKALDDHIGDN